MTAIRLYLDEDSLAASLLHALRVRGVDVRTASEDGMRGRDDEAQLRWATQQARTLYSYNVRDFFRLHTAFLTRGEAPAGLVLVQQRRYAIGDQVHGLLRLSAATPAEGMVQRVEFLGAWI